MQAEVERCRTLLAERWRSISTTAPRLAVCIVNSFMWTNGWILYTKSWATDVRLSTVVIREPAATLSYSTDMTRMDSWAWTGDGKVSMTAISTLPRLTVTTIYRIWLLCVCPMTTAWRRTTLIFGHHRVSSMWRRVAIPWQWMMLLLSVWRPRLSFRLKAMRSSVATWLLSRRTYLPGILRYWLP